MAAAASPNNRPSDRSHAAQRVETIIRAAFEKDREVEPLLAEAALQPIENREKDRVDQGVVRSARHDHRHKIGFSAP
jgi:hypothetical protein